MNREQYLEYVDHFNNKRYDAVTSYFTPDVTVEYCTNLGSPETPARTLHGRQEFIDSYRTLHEHVREVLELGDFLASGNLMAVELYTEFHCFKDYPSMSSRPMRKGDVTIMTNWVIYNLEGGKMKRIRIAHFRMHDSKLAKF
ncbi:MAG: nuclear transport factor 2 family protein [Thermodesulfobacteriota bacterium]|jgi:hypothetical protein